MTAYGIFGDVEASPKLVRAALSDLLEAHRRSTPADDFWLNVGVRDGNTKIYDEVLDWTERNEIYTEVVTPASGYQPFVTPAKLTVSGSFMLDVVESMRREQGGKILALVGDQTPPTDVLRALAKAKDNGTEIRDLAEAGLTLVLFRGDDPPPDSEEETPMATDEEDTVELTYPELGAYADDESDAETAEEAQNLLTEAAKEAGIDPDDYATWAEVGAALEEGGGGAEDAGEPEDDEEAEEEETEEEEEEEEAEPEEDGLTREQLVGKDIAEIKALAKAAGIEGYSKMRREPLIRALLGEESEESPPAATTPPAKKATGAAKKAAPKNASNGDVGPGGAGITDGDVARIANAVVAKLASTLSEG